MSMLEPDAATQALIAAEGRARPTTHPRTQDQVAHLWVKRQAAVGPFSFAATAGSQSKMDPHAYLNGPGRAVDTSVHPYTNCGKENCWDIAALALRTTRNDPVQKRLQDQRANKACARRKA
jgi:hypothetical protein